MRDTLREGFARLAAGHLDEASACCRRLLGAKPDLVEAHFLVGLVALELKDHATAVSAFGSVTRLQEDHGAAWANLARLFLVAGQPLRADAALTKAVEHHDGNPLVLDLIGSIHGLLGDQDEAAVWIGRAVLEAPDNVAFLVNQANSHMFLGKLADAEAVLRKVLQLSPENPNAHWVLSNLRKATNSEHVEELQRLLEREDRNPRAQAFRCYGLGKELEDLERWDEAFEAFARGAEARRGTVDFDEDSEIEMYDAFSSVFTAEWFRQGHAGFDDPSPIFVVGQPRTGTTLVERIITSHSQVHSAGELKQFGHSVRRLADYPGTETALGEARNTGRRYRCRKTGPRLHGDDGEDAWHAAPLCRQIAAELPLHTANPESTAASQDRAPDPQPDGCLFASFKQLFADAYPHSYDQAEMARHHARYYHLMAVWRERFAGRFLDISYEDTARDIEPNARALLEFLELPWEDACLEFHRQDAAVTTASAVQVRQPAHTRSIDRWRRYERQLAPMRQTLEEEGVPTGLP
ncbi:MAG: sulfotransferase [Woeseiaceae bacterium]|nr:sulfotransferase [Woeseiaceae bacterium]